MIPASNFQNMLSFSKSSFASRLLKGSGQIMLQENAITGILFYVGIFYGSILMGAAAIFATACGTATAMLLKYDPSEIDKGLYGFSSALVGVGAIVFFKPVFICWLFIGLGAMAATILQNFFIRRNIPVFTFPFVLVSWILLLFANLFFSGALATSSLSDSTAANYFETAFKGYGQIIFQDNVVSGLLFFMGVFINSPIAALYGLASAILSAFVASFLFVPVEAIGAGLFSFNAVLCAITFAGKEGKDSMWVVISVFMSIAISIVMYKYALVQLTFPFVLSSFITTYLRKKFYHLMK